jgi:serine/threonine protein phosphatase PrpC
MEAAVPQLEVRVGWCTERGRREANEDYVGVWTGTAQQRARRGIVAAVADGVGGAPGGRVAAKTAVRAFIDFYLS